MATRAQLKADKRRAEEGIRRAEGEIRKLTKQLKAGTLDRNTLESGLKKVTETLLSIPPHHPPP